MGCEIKLSLGDNMTVTVTGTTAKETVELAGEFGEMPNQCVCKSRDIFFSVRRVEDGKYTYYGLKCRDCNREFALGETRDHRLFPKRDEGWLTFKERMERKEAMAAQAVPAGAPRGGPTAPPSGGYAGGRPPLPASAFPGGGYGAAPGDDDIPF
jgi:hypothetical protein